MKYGKKKKMKDGGMAKKVHDATVKAMKDMDANFMSKSPKNFQKDYESLRKKIEESMKTGKSGMKDGGMAKKKMAMGGKLKPVDKKKNPGLAKLPTEVRNRMGFMKKGGDVKKAGQKAGELGAAIAKVKKKQGMKKGGMAKKKMMGGGMAMKYKKGGMTKKCPRDGIAMRGKTRA